MANSQLTTLLLLVIVGFLIYHLTQPDNVDNEGELETNMVEDSIEASNKQNNIMESGPEDIQLPDEESNDMEEEIPTEDMNFETQGMDTSEPIMETRREPRMETNMESRMEPRMEPQMTEETQMETPLNKMGQLNDTSGLSSAGLSSSAGASLDQAFSSSVPSDATVDKIDFNRNNVTEYDAKQYLPQEVNDEWFDTDFTQSKYTLNDDKMIQTDRYVIGVNTVGQTLKNPSYDIRGTIPNPKYTVSPWMNSTYEPDNNIKPLY